MYKTIGTPPFTLRQPWVSVRSLHTLAFSSYRKVGWGGVGGEYSEKVFFGLEHQQPFSIRLLSGGTSV